MKQAISGEGKMKVLPRYGEMDESSEVNMVTVAELCVALSSQTLPARKAEGYYNIQHRDFLRFARSQALEQATLTIDPELRKYFAFAS